MKCGGPVVKPARMTLRQWLTLLLLSAIWGASFIFMRIVAPALGPFWTAALRIFIGGTALALFCWLVRRQRLGLRRWGKHYLAIGIINSAIPFTLFAFAAQHIPAGYSVVLNATSPLFGVLVGRLWLGESLTLRKIMGLLLGAFGVSLVVKLGATQMSANFWWSVVACLVAAACYAVGGLFIKKLAGQGVSSLCMSASTQLLGALVLSPLLVVSPIKGVVDLRIIAALFGLALLCSALAYLLYYQLIADIGPSKALTVTLLMPLFGMLWGAIFLGEAITGSMVLGAALIISGIRFVMSVPSGRGTSYPAS